MRATPEEKLAHALELMATGLRLERERLRRERREASECEIDAL